MKQYSWVAGMFGVEVVKNFTLKFTHIFYSEKCATMTDFKFTFQFMTLISNLFSLFGEIFDFQLFLMKNI